MTGWTWYWPCSKRMRIFTSPLHWLLQGPLPPPSSPLVDSPTWTPRSALSHTPSPTTSTSFHCPNHEFLLQRNALFLLTSFTLRTRPKFLSLWFFWVISLCSHFHVFLECVILFGKELFTALSFYLSIFCVLMYLSCVWYPCRGRKGGGFQVSVFFCCCCLAHTGQYIVCGRHSEILTE